MTGSALPVDAMVSVPFSELGVRFGWTPWREAGDEQGGMDRIFDVAAIKPVQFDGVWSAWGNRKPFGGLWLSPLVDDAPLKSLWAQWCEEHEEPYGATVEVALSSSARVCVLDSGADVERLAARFPGVTYPPYPSDGLREPAVDWVRVGEHVDAVYMTAKAERDTMALSTPWPRSEG